MTRTLYQANIPVEGLFLNADAGFDSKEFRLCCEKNEINANICFNKRNGDTDRDEYFDQLIYNERYKIERTNDPAYLEFHIFEPYDTVTPVSVVRL